MTNKRTNKANALVKMFEKKKFFLLFFFPKFNSVIYLHSPNKYENYQCFISNTFLDIVYIRLWLKHLERGLTKKKQEKKKKKKKKKNRGKCGSVFFFFFFFFFLVSHGSVYTR